MNTETGIDASDLVHKRIRYLYESTDFLSTIFERLTGYAVIAADFDGGIIAYNEGAKVIFGYGPKEVVGKKSADIFFPEVFIHKGGFQKLINDLMHEGERVFEGEMVRKGGEKFPANIILALTRDKSGKVVGFIEIVEDLSEQKLSEKLRRQQQEHQISELEAALKEQQSLTGWQEGSITAGLAGVGPLRERSPDVFYGFQSAYEVLLDVYLDAIGFREPPPGCEINGLADRIGAVGGGPRDVVDLHIRSVESKVKGVNPQRARAYTVEGRLLALELMGNLVDYYRIRRT